MANSVTRVLVVEDNPHFRRFVSSILQERPGLQIVCELSDGLEAVEQAEKLRPDLILLDIGLPGLNGMEAARRIRRVAPGSKILFLSLESSPEVVEEALNLGAQGYVLKSRAAGDLLTAIEAVMQGGQFISSALAGRVSQMESPGQFWCNDALTSSTAPDVVRQHPVRFYADDAAFLDDFTCFVTGAIRANKLVLVVTSQSHRASLIERLQASGMDVAAAIDQKRYVTLDVAEFTRGGLDLALEAATKAAGTSLDLAVG